MGMWCQVPREPKKNSLQTNCNTYARSREAGIQAVTRGRAVLGTHSHGFPPSREDEKMGILSTDLGVRAQLKSV